MKTTLLMTLGTILGSSLIVCAEDAAPPTPPAHKPDRPHGPLPPELLKKYDKDGDGKLSDAEREQMHKDHMAEMLKKYDTDGDGKLSDEEKAKMPKPAWGGPGGHHGGPGGPGPHGGKGPDGKGGPGAPPDGGAPPPPPPPAGQ